MYSFSSIFFKDDWHPRMWNPNQLIEAWVYNCSSLGCMGVVIQILFSQKTIVLPFTEIIFCNHFMLLVNAYAYIHGGLLVRIIYTQMILDYMNWTLYFLQINHRYLWVFVFVLNFPIEFESKDNNYIFVATWQSRKARGSWINTIHGEVVV